ncbi:MAG: flagellar basal body-associated FliL family protein [Ancalomicrobiaceae bacterium]|nr:flagellar basal body-associated FliL family protein [Ancalomicrobiaceae bacterium]
MAKQPEKKSADAGDDETPSSGGNKKKLMIFGGAGLAVLLIAGGAGAYFLGVFGGKPKEADATHPAVTVKPALFVDLPEIVVNLSSVDQRASYLKLKIALEVSQKETVDKIQPVMPRVLDAFQVYLRELRTTDLDGSAGLFRVKEELQRRVNIAIYPAHVDQVLFREILLQ